MFWVPGQDDDGSPWPILEDLLIRAPELAHLAGMLADDMRIAFMFRDGEWQEGNRKSFLGMCFLPGVQGKLKPLFDQLLEEKLGYMPDWLIVLSGDWWENQDDRNREILVFHECLHAGQAIDREGNYRINNETGRPIPAIIPHDVEEFTAVVARYGAWNDELADFIAASKKSPGLVVQFARTA